MNEIRHYIASKSLKMIERIVIWGGGIFKRVSVRASVVHAQLTGPMHGSFRVEIIALAAGYRLLDVKESRLKE